MSGNVADVAPERAEEDIETIDDDINNLFKRFIDPVEKIRSISRPDISQAVVKSDSSGSLINKSNFKNLTINNSRPLESRAHALYRYIGFPVVGSDDSFYNAGFDPSDALTSDNRQSINAKIDQPVQTLMNDREKNPEEIRQVFARQDISSSLYAILLRYPLPFNVLAEDSQPLAVDKQFFKVDDRTTQALFFSELNPQLSDGLAPFLGSFTGARHILRPFIVDPRIENTVMPDSNKISVPFLLNKNDLKLNAAENVFLKRPGIELILRQRLSDQGFVNLDFLNDIKNVIAGVDKPSVDTTTLDRQTLVDLIEALNVKNTLTSSATDIFTTFTSTQITQVTTLIKTIKVVIKQLFQAMLTIDDVKQNINWVPVPSVNGPGTGSVGADLSRGGSNNAQSSIDNTIVELRVKKLNAQVQINNQEDLGEFASPFAGGTGIDSVKKFDDQLQEQIQKRDSYAKDGLDAMGVIETITGEVSGLGLIDVLCIYTALWSIDMDTLINFLDNKSFERLYNNNPEFAGVSEVDKRNNGTTMSITTVLANFETKLSNLLSFADKLLNDSSVSPLESFGGQTE